MENARMALFAALLGGLLLVGLLAESSRPEIATLKPQARPYDGGGFPPPTPKP